MSARRVALGVTAGIAGGAALIAVINILSRIVGFGRQLVFQSTIGQTVLGEIYTTVNALPNVVFEIVAGGALASVVVPLIAAAVSRGDTEHVRQTVSALLGWTLVVLVPMALLGVLLAGPIAELMLRGKGGSEGVQVARTFLLVFMPQIPLYGIAVVTSGVLQGHRRFLAVALAPVVSSLVMVPTYLVFARAFTGDRNDLSALDRRSELILAGGTTLAVLMLALTTLVPMLMRASGVRPTLSFPPGVARRAAGLAGAGVVTLAAQQLAYLTSFLMSNEHAGIGGAVTFLNSWMVYLLPYAVLAVPIAIAAFPRLATHAETDPQAYARTLAASTRAVLAVSGVGVAVLVASAWPVARFFNVLDQGDDVPAERMAWALVAFAPGLLGYGLVAHLGRALYARGQGRVAATATASGWLLVVVAAIVLASVVTGERVTAGLGAAHSAGMTLAGVLLLLGVARDSGRAALRGVGRSLAGVVVAATAGGAAGWWVASLLPTDDAGAVIGSGLLSAVVAGAVAVGVVVVVDRKALLTLLRRRSP